MGSDDAVLAQHNGSVLVLTINRPEKSNAFSPDVVSALSRHLRSAGDDPAVNVVVLTGSGRAFCAGLDLKHLVSLKENDRPAYLQSVLDVFRMVWNLPQPVVAAVNGAAVAGGFDLSVFCDLRVAADDAVFAQTEILIGVNPISSPLFHLIGLGNARELGLTGNRINASEAHRIGLVNHVVPAPHALRKALELAQQIASRPRHATAATKRLTREAIDVDMDAALEDAGNSILRGFASPAQKAVLEEYVQRLSSKKRDA